MKHLRLPARSPFMTALAVLLLISGSLAGCGSDKEDAAMEQATSATTAQAAESPCATAEPEYIVAEYAAYVRNAEDLVQNVDDVFIGTVLSAGETFSPPGHSDLWTPFSVAVKQRLLGSVEGTITVAQMGGCDPDQNRLVIVKGELMLEVGETYMLATRTSRNSDRPDWEGQHVSQPFKGRVRINDEAHRQQLIQEYTEAITQAGLGS